MADALWESASMRALRPQFADERDGDSTLWQLPNWDEYSEVGASVSTSECNRLDISVCSSDALDFGDDSSSSLNGANGGDDDDAFKRRKLRRSPVSITGGGGDSLPRRKSVLQQLHQRYAKQRQLEELTSHHVRTNSNRSDSRDGDDKDQPTMQIKTSLVRGQGNRGAAKDRVVVATTAVKAAVAEEVGDDGRVPPDANAIAAQQSALNTQLQSFRSQLTEMQKRMTPDMTASATKSALVSVGTDQQSSPPSTTSRNRYETSIQTNDARLRDDTVMQWLNLLTQKIELLASDYGHDATQSYRATIEHLSGFKTASTTTTGTVPTNHEQHQQSASSAPDPQALQQATWHVGGALEPQLSAPTAARFLDLETSLARLSSAFENSSRRKLDLFEKSIRQIEQFHHEKLQQVVNESIDELKQVRGKYKVKQEQLEEQVRLATRAADEWRQKAAEIKHKSTYEREKIEFQAATFREKFERLSVRFDEDIVNITQQLDTARNEKLEAQRRQTASREEVEQLRQELASLQEQHSVLNDKRESESRAFEQEQQRWKTILDQVRRENDAVVQETSNEKHLLAKSLEDAVQRHASELATLRNQFQMEVEDTYRATIVSEKIVELQRRHEKQLETLRQSYEQQVKEQGQAVEKALEEVRKSRQAQMQASSAETQMEPSTVTLHPFDRLHSTSDREAEVRIQELSRKCRALESLLDKKFEQQSATSSQYGGSTSPLCMSCNSSSNNNSIQNDDSPRSPQASLRSSGNFLLPEYEPVSSKLAQLNTSATRHLARKKELAASSHAASSLDDALFTDVDTTMRNETWDSASMTSIDTFDPSTPSSFRVFSRPQSASRSINKGNANGVPSNADILALVRKLETYAATSPSLNNEPESEQSIVFRTPESHTKKAQPPPIHRMSRHHLKRDASAPGARKLNRPSTSLTQRPLRGSLLSGSSSSSSSSSASENQRSSSGRTTPAAAGTTAPRSRFT